MDYQWRFVTIKVGHMFEQPPTPNTNQLRCLHIATTTMQRTTKTIQVQTYKKKRPSKYKLLGATNTKLFHDNEK